jgi:NTE family protein
MLDAIFLDMLDYDALNTRRVNSLLEAHSHPQDTGLQPVQLLLIRPSIDLSLLANEYESRLPATFRFATRGLGTREARRSDMLATLLFEHGYIRRMIAVGENDCANRLDEIAAFLALKPTLTRTKTAA